MSKDLTKASSAVEATEDCIMRFQETFSAHVDRDISNVNNAIFWQSTTAPPSLDVTEMNEVRPEAEVRAGTDPTEQE